MTCSDWELKIAAEMEDPALAEHLRGCEACRGFAHELAENSAALRSFEVNPAAYTAVRARVLEVVRPKRRFSWLWAAAAVAACIVLLWWTTVTRHSPAPPHEVARKLPAPETNRQPTPSRSRLGTEAHAPTAVAAIRHPRRLIARSDPLTAIKLLTDDPNVVIIWLVDKKGD